MNHRHQHLLHMFSVPRLTNRFNKVSMANHLLNYCMEIINEKIKIDKEQILQKKENVFDK